MNIEGLHYATGRAVDVRLENGRIQEVRETSRAAVALPWIAPGLVDLQINGYAGMDFNTPPVPEDRPVKATQALWQEGVTSYFPTIITNSDEAIAEEMRAVARACEKDRDAAAGIAGIHLEGPFISSEDGPRGSHPKVHVKPPDWALFQRWQEASGGRIRIVTLSPEWPGSAAFIAQCVAGGVTVSVGHTGATPQQIREAVAAGARMSTHLGNGAHVALPRHPNYLWEQLAQDALWVTIIADGFHLPESFLRVTLKVKGRQAMLVSDAVYLSGMEPGQYRTHIGGSVVLVPGGRLHIADNPALLAGSVRMLSAGVAHLVASGLCPFAEAWEMASTRPSEFMGLPSRAGLAPGAPADLAVFERKGASIRILQTWKEGRKVYDILS